MNNFKIIIITYNNNIIKDNKSITLSNLGRRAFVKMSGEWSSKSTHKVLSFDSTAKMLGTCRGAKMLNTKVDIIVLYKYKIFAYGPDTFYFGWASLKKKYFFFSRSSII